MSLGECPDCQSSVSLNAVSCPNCGCPFVEPEAKSGGFSWITSIAIGLAVGYGVLSYNLGRPATPNDIKFLTGIEGPTCENILSSIYNMSQENRAQYDGATVIQITPSETTSQTETSVDCVGTAKWSDGSQTAVIYKSYEDQGQVWLEMQPIRF